MAHNKLWSTKQKDFPNLLDGVNDYFIGIDGVNGFSISQLANKGSITISMLVYFPVTVDASTAPQRLFEVSDNPRTSTYAIDIGAATGSMAGEVILVSRNIGGSLRARGWNAGGASIAAGWHHIGLRQSSTSNTVVFLDRTNLTMTDVGAGQLDNFTTLFTANRLSIGATAIPSGYANASIKEITILSGVSSDNEVFGLYDYYTAYGNLSLNKTSRSAWKFFSSTVGRARIVGHWDGREVSGNLIERTGLIGNLTVNR